MSRYRGSYATNPACQNTRIAWQITSDAFSNINYDSGAIPFQTNNVGPLLKPSLIERLKCREQGILSPLWFRHDQAQRDVLALACMQLDNPFRTHNFSKVNQSPSGTSGQSSDLPRHPLQYQEVTALKIRQACGGLLCGGGLGSVSFIPNVFEAEIHARALRDQSRANLRRGFVSTSARSASRSQPPNIRFNVFAQARTSDQKDAYYSEGFLDSEMSLVTPSVIGSHAAPVTSLSWYSVDHGLSVSGSLDGTMRLWDMSTGMCALTVDCPAPIRSVQFCPSTSLPSSISDNLSSAPTSFTAAPTHSALIAIASDVVRIYDIEVGGFTHTLATTAPDSVAMSLHASSTSPSSLSAASSARRVVARSWCVQWNPLNDNQLWVGGSDGSVVLNDLRKSGIVKSLSMKSTSSSSSTPLSTSSSSVASGGQSLTNRSRMTNIQSTGMNDEETVSLWDDRALRGRGHYAHEGPVTSLIVTQDGRILTTGVDKRLRLWDAVTGHLAQTHFAPTGNSEWLTSNCLSRDETMYYYVDGPGATAGPMGNSSSSNTSSGGDNMGHRNEMGTAGIVRVFDIASGRATKVLQAHMDTIVTVDVWEGDGDDDGPTLRADVGSGGKESSSNVDRYGDVGDLGDDSGHEEFDFEAYYSEDEEWKRRMGGRRREWLRDVDSVEQRSGINSNTRHSSGGRVVVVTGSRDGTIGIWGRNMMNVITQSNDQYPTSGQSSSSTATSSNYPIGLNSLLNNPIGVTAPVRVGEDDWSDDET